MSKILKEVREVSSQKIAEQQTQAENAYPKIIEKIKTAASTGKTECQFKKWEIDEHTKRLLQNDGFGVYVTTRKMSQYEQYFPQQKESESIWIVSW